MYHEHPLRILKYSMKNIWLLIFPLLRELHSITFDADKLYRWLKGAWFDIAVIGAIIIFGLIRWYFSRITLTDEDVIHTEGAFVKKRTAIPCSSLCSITVEHSFYLRPFGAMRIYCDTSAGIFSSSDMKLLVNKNVCEEMMKKIPRVREKDGIAYNHKPNLISILFFSVFFSSSFSGVVYVAAFFFKGGDIAQDIISVSFDRITAETSKIPFHVIRKIPAAAIGIGSFFIVAWLLSFTINMLRYYGFFIKSDKSRIEVTCGTFTKRRFTIIAKQINYADLRQNLIMKIFNAVTVNISCAGYGSQNKNIPVLFPIRKKKYLNSTLEKIGISPGSKNVFRPKLTSVWQYIWQPVIIGLCAYPLSEAAALFFPKFADLSYLAMIMAEIPSIWMILVKAAAAATSKISIYEEKIIINYSKGFGFHTVIADRKRLAKMKVTQTPAQRVFRKCKVSFYFNGESAKKHCVKGIKVKDACNIGLLLGYNEAVNLRR
ncbi:MAG: PH domain-containing protein [Ruminococcus sp.]|nr:PH domain-containing protein [Ruminococcus sp.]